jgi:uncharacterized protein YjbI with pentapeptide repeats
MARVRPIHELGIGEAGAEAQDDAAYRPIYRRDGKGHQASLAHADAADFSSATAQDSDFIGIRFESVKFYRADLSRSSFIRASLSSCNLCDANLSGADFSMASLANSRFNGADLNAANLTSAVLVGAQLRRRPPVVAA